MEEEVDVNEILSAVERMSDHFIYTEKAFKCYIEENDPRQVLFKIISLLKEQIQIDGVLSNKTNDKLKCISEALEFRDNFLKKKQQELVILQNELKQKQDYLKRCEKCLNTIREKVIVLEKQKELSGKKKLEILVYKLLTNTSFDFKTSHICGCITGQNERVEVFKFASNSSQHKISDALWRKVKEINEV